jgi:uncharacterized membrane protein HdeD (DUF308 family)
MLKKFSKFMWLSIGACALFMLIGILLLVFPDISLKIISYLIAFGLIIIGIILVVDYSGSLFLVSFLPTGILSKLLGIIVLIYPQSVTILVPIVIGIWMVINSVLGMQMAMSLKQVGYKNWLLAVILAAITIICGFLIIVNPSSGAVALTEFCGIMLIIYSICDVIDLFIFKNNINDIAKLLK